MVLTCLKDDPDNRPAGVEMCSQMTDVIRAINPLENGMSSIGIG